MVNPPDLLLAARERFVSSGTFATLLASEQIGVSKSGSGSTPWVFIAINPASGKPYAAGIGKAAITFYKRSSDWYRNDTSARFPVLSCVVWSQGVDVEDVSADWLARSVAEAVIAEFDDPAREKPKQWSDTVYVIGCRWTGELSVSPMENLPGSYRADFGFEMEVA